MWRRIIPTTETRWALKRVMHTARVIPVDKQRSCTVFDRNYTLLEMVGLHYEHENKKHMQHDAVPQCPTPQQETFTFFSLSSRFLRNEAIKKTHNDLKRERVYFHVSITYWLISHQFLALYMQECSKGSHRRGWCHGRKFPQSSAEEHRSIGYRRIDTDRMLRHRVPQGRVLRFDRHGWYRAPASVL